MKEHNRQCPNCGAILDRDLNASINIINYGK
ncbi:zinc ribbon domain-containing protein [Methanobrevibacter sp.]